MFDGIQKQFRNHPILSSVGALAVFAIILFGLYVLLGPQISHLFEPTVSEQNLGEGQAMLRSAIYGESSPSDAPHSPGQAGQTLKVKTAELTGESDDLDGDIERIRSIAEENGGYIQNGQKNKSTYTVTYRATLRVEADQFKTVIDTLKESLSIEDYSLRDYRISIQSSLDEIDVLNKTINKMKEIRHRIERMEPDNRMMELLMQLNSKQLQLIRQLKQYERQLAESRYQSQMATINLTLTQDLEAEISYWPEDVSRWWKNNIREMNRTLARSLVDTLPTVVMILAKTLQFIIYFLAVIFPLWLLFLVGRYAYRKTGQTSSTNE